MKYAALILLGLSISYSHNAQAMEGFLAKVKQAFSHKARRVPNSDLDFRLGKKAEHFPFDFDRWYGSLSEHSFYSEIIPITPQIAQSMVKYYQHRFMRRKLLTERDVENLLALKQSIQKTLDSMNARGHSTDVFVRMSNRSPKDGTPLLLGRQPLLSTCQAVLEDPALKTLNDKLVRICDLQMEMLKCPDSDHVMNLLLTSERVYTDLNLALDCHQASLDDEWSTSVILREWEPGLRQEMEFRVFVHEGKVTAISQYNHYCRYDSLAAIVKSADEEQLKEKISNFVKARLEDIGLQDFVLDVAVMGENVKVIELNPFIESTGPCLFNWRADAAVLKGSSGSVALRVREKDIENLEPLMHSILNNEEELAASGLIPYYALLNEIKPGCCELPKSRLGK